VEPDPRINALLIGSSPLCIADGTLARGASLRECRWVLAWGASLRECRWDARGGHIDGSIRGLSMGSFLRDKGCISCI